MAMLAFFMLAAFGFALVHNHYKDLGKTVNYSCPLCSFVLGFVCCCFYIVTFFITAYGINSDLPENQNHRCCEFRTPFAARPPPSF